MENSASASSILDLTKSNGTTVSSTSTLVESSTANLRRDRLMSNLSATDDPFYLCRLDSDSRRNSILSDVYLADENLTLDGGVSDALLENACNVNFLKDFPSRDVSLVEQVAEVDKLVTKVLKALVIAGERSTGESMNTHSPVGELGTRPWVVLIIA